MVEVGSIQIGGSIQTSEIERGLSRVEKGFKDIETTGKGVNADFMRINQQAGRLAKRMSILGLVGGGAMLAIAKGAPATAGAMAKLKIEGGKLSRTLGEILRPAFDMVAEGLQNFVNWLQEHKPTLTHFTNVILGGFKDALYGIRLAWDWITTNVKDVFAKIGIEFDLGEVGNWLFEHYGPEAIAALIGFKVGGPWGAAIGAGAMYAGRRIAKPELYIEEARMSGFGFGNLMGIGPFSWNPFKKLNMKQAVLGEEDRA